MALLDIGLDITSTDSTNSHDITIFAFFDYDLDAGSDGDFIDGSLSQISQFDDLSSADTFPTEFFFEGAGLVNPAGFGAIGPTQFDIDEYPNALHDLEDVSITNFTSGTTSLGNLDATFGFQWEVTLPPSDAATIDVHTVFHVVPEPGTYAMLLIGIGSLLLFGRVGWS